MATNPEYGPPPGHPITRDGQLVDTLWYQWFDLLRSTLTGSSDKSIEDYLSNSNARGIPAIETAIKDLEVLVHSALNNKFNLKVYFQDVTSSRAIDTIYHNNTGKPKLIQIAVKLSA